MNDTRAFLLFLLIAFSPISFAEDIVLFPIEINPDIPTHLNDAQLFGSALQEGLQHRYDKVYYGPAVEAYLEIEFSKEDCTAEECIENTLINFSTNRYLEVSINVEPSGYIIVIKQFDLLDQGAFRAQTSTCDPCNKTQFIQHLKRLGSNNAQQNLEFHQVQSNNHATHWTFYTLATKGIKRDEDLIQDEQISIGFEWRIHPKKKSLGFGIAPSLSFSKHEAAEFGSASNLSIGLRTLLYFKSFLSLGIQTSHQMKPTKFDQVKNNNLLLHEGLLGLHWPVDNISLNAFYLNRFSKNTPFNQQAFSVGIGYEF